jgi:hypothetical protein
VHGINNENTTAADIADVWLRALQEGWAAAGCVADTAGMRTGAAYYGDKLANAASRWDRNKLTIIDQGGNDVAEDEEVATLYAEYGHVLYEEHGY